MVIALVVFLIAYIFIASEKFPRHWIALIGGDGAHPVGRAESARSVSLHQLGNAGAAGRHVCAGWRDSLEEAGLFKMAGNKTVITEVELSSRLAVCGIGVDGRIHGDVDEDSITVMLKLSVLTLQLCRLLELNPVPLIVAEVCAANTVAQPAGGRSTRDVILGATLGFNFADFAQHSGPLSPSLALDVVWECLLCQSQPPERRARPH